MDLIVWKEKRLSEGDDAEQRYRKILANESLSSFDSLDIRIQQFINEISSKYPGSILIPNKGQSPADNEYSRLGVVVRFDDDPPEGAYDDVLGAATELDLTLYDPEMGMVLGYDDSVDIEIYDND